MKIKILGFTLILLGVIGLIGTITVTPDFTLKYLSFKHHISPEGLSLLRTYRFFSLIVGCIFLLAGILSLIFHKKFLMVTIHLKYFPIFYTVGFLVIGGIGLTILNYIFIKTGMSPGTPKFFLVSVFQSKVNYFGLPYAILFLSVFYWIFKHDRNVGLFQCWLIGLTLLVLGNLVQGDWDTAFLKPFYGTGDEYYNDALKINFNDWRKWLVNFNLNQPNLLVHTQTHPPFAVLIQYFLLKIGGDRLFVLSGVFVLFSSLTMILVWKIMETVGLNKQKCFLLTILFSVIPAYNIYSAVCLDGVIATGSTLFLLGLIKIIKRGLNVSGVFYLTIGIFFTNLLTFLGTFLIATASLLAIREIIMDKRYHLTAVLSFNLTLGFIVWIILRDYYGYDHVQAFFTAAKLQNPDGLFKTHTFIQYVMTRIESVTEIALFLSLGILAVIFHYDYMRIRLWDLSDTAVSIFFSGIVSLLLMFVAGAFRGETARACLFIYPYFLLLLKNTQTSTLRMLLVVAGWQTVIMQTFGDYHW